MKKPKLRRLANSTEHAGREVVPGATEKDADSPQLNSLAESAAQLNNRELWISLLGFVLLTIAIYHPVSLGGKTLISMANCSSIFPNGPWRSNASYDELMGEDPPIPQTVNDALGSMITDEVSPYLTSIMMRQGHLPWINPYQGMGHPWIADLMSAVFFPLQIIPILIPSSLSWDIYLLLRVVLFGWFTYLFLRRAGLGRIAAATGGGACSCGGYTVGWINLFHINVDIFLPLALYFVESWIQTPRAKYPLLLLFTISAAFLGGNPQPLILIFGALVVYAVLRILLSRDTSLTAGVSKAIRALAMGAIACAGGLLLVSFVLFPFLELYREAFHTHSSGTSTLSVTRGNWIFFFLPALHTNELGINISTAESTDATQALYGTGLVLAPFLALSLAHWRKFTALIAPMLLLFVLFMLKICGVEYGGLIRKLPVISSILFAKYVIVPVFAGAVLTSVGVDWLMRLNRARGYLLLKFGAAAVILVVIGGLVFWLTTWVKGLGDIQGGVFVPRMLRVITLYKYLAICAALCLLGALFFRHGGRRIQIALLCVPLLGEWLLNTYRPYPERLKPNAVPPFVEFLQEKQKTESEFRIYGIGSVLYPNSSSIFGLQDYRMFDALVWEPFFMFNRTMVTGTGTGFYDNYIGSRKPEIARSPFLDICNVRYVIGEASPHAESVVRSLTETGHITTQPNSRPGYTFSNAGARVRHSLYLPAPLTWTWKYKVPTPDEELRFYWGNEPKPQPPHLSTGLGLKIACAVGDRKYFLYEGFLEPASKVEDRRWVATRIPLGQFHGQTIDLFFKTDPGPDGDPTCDMLLMGDVSFRSLDQRNQELRLVHDEDLFVYENAGAKERAFLAPAMRIAADWSEMKALHDSKPEAISTAPIFLRSPEAEAALREVGQDLQGSPHGDLRVVSAGSYEQEYEVQVSRPTILFVSELAYPGWIVEVDGRRKPLLRGYGCMQSVVVPQGKHTVRFYYAPSSVRIGIGVSMATALAILLFVFRGRLLAKFHSREDVISAHG